MAFKVAMCADGICVSLMEEPAREEEKKAHSSKPNEKLGKIAFRLPSSDFRHTAARLQCVERVIPQLDRFS